MDHNDKMLGRRRTLQLLGVGLAATGLLGLEACKKDAPSADNGGGGGGATDCASQIDEASKTTRRTLQYNDKAAVAEKKCGACAQYEAGKYGDCGGGCKVITGPVNPNGGCLAFAPKGAEGGPPT